jgi:hypothetical protein
MDGFKFKGAINTDVLNQKLIDGLSLKKPRVKNGPETSVELKVSEKVGLKNQVQNESEDKS